MIFFVLLVLVVLGNCTCQTVPSLTIRYFTDATCTTSCTNKGCPALRGDELMNRENVLANGVCHEHESVHQRNDRHVGIVAKCNHGVAEIHEFLNGSPCLEEGSFGRHVYHVTSEDGKCIALGTHYTRGPRANNQKIWYQITGCGPQHETAVVGPVNILFYTDTFCSVLLTTHTYALVSMIGIASPDAYSNTDTPCHLYSSQYYYKLYWRDVNHETVQFEYYGTSPCRSRIPLVGHVHMWYTSLTFNVTISRRASSSNPACSSSPVPGYSMAASNFDARSPSCLIDPVANAEADNGISDRSSNPWSNSRCIPIPYGGMQSFAHSARISGLPSHINSTVSVTHSEQHAIGTSADDTQEVRLD